MRIVIVDTYYPAFLAARYRLGTTLVQQPYRDQLAAMIDALFGTSDFYSRHLNALGCEAFDIVANCIPLQAMWARENSLPHLRAALRVPARFFRVPLIGRVLAFLPNIVDIAVAQIKALKPDVLYCQDLNFLPPNVLLEIRKHVRLIVGQIASPLPPSAFLAGYDLVLTSFPHFVDRLRALGLRSDYFRIGFDSRVLERLGAVSKDIASSFVGGISRHHTRALPLLDRVARDTQTEFFGYGASALPADSPIRARHHGEVWGVDMYRALARSRVTLNRHIGVAERFANNMRLYEATGVGSLLVTDRKENLPDLFEPGREVVAYDSIDEAVEMISYYTAHLSEAETIAKAGQQRTLAEHTYAHRMRELVPLLRRHLQS